MKSSTFQGQVILTLLVVLIPEMLYGLPTVNDSYSYTNDVTDDTNDVTSNSYDIYDYGYYYSYPGDDYEMYDPQNFFRLGTPFCDQKATCSPPYSFSWPSKNCYCDDLCQWFEDCCSNFEPSVSVLAPPKDLFECILVPEIDKRYGIFAVSKCPPEWPDRQTKSLCETGSNGKDVLLRLPVSENDTEVLFKNMYCANCNSRYDFNFWKPEMMCEIDSAETHLYDISTLPNCDLTFLPPSRDSAFKFRKCSMDKIVSACPPNTTDEILNDECVSGNTSHVFADNDIFRNIACAECHGVPPDLIYCEPAEQLYGTPDHDKKKTYSFRALVDFNSNEGEFGRIMEETGLDFSQKCSDDEIYDPFSEKCRKIFCVPPRVPVKGKCVTQEESALISKVSSVHMPVDTGAIAAVPENCTLTRLLPSEFEKRNNSDLFMFSSQKVYNKSEYFELESGTFICYEELSNCLSGCKRNMVFQSDIVESYVTLVLLVVSLTALAFNFFVYCCFPQLRNTPGKILMCLIISLFLAQLSFLVSPHLEEYRIACMVSAAFVHFFFIAAFCWMNIIALDLWMTFSNQFITAGSNETSRRFIYFSIYAWVVPSVIVAFSVIIDNLEIESELQNFQPRYGDGACWMTSRNGVLLLFAGPLAVFKLFDIIAFINTAIHIYKAKRHGATARKNNDSCTFWLNLKLSLVMGLTWVFAFVANLANESIIWYLFIIFNALQGVFIAVTFIFTRKVIRLLSEKAQELSSLTTKSTIYEASASDRGKRSRSSSRTKSTPDGPV